MARRRPPTEEELENLDIEVEEEGALEHVRTDADRYNPGEGMGRYLVPDHLKGAFVDAFTDENLLSVRPQVAMMEARSVQLLADINDAHKRWKAAVGDGNVRAADAAKKDEDRYWREWHNLARSANTMRESERDRIVKAQELVSADVAVQAIERIAMAMKGVVDAAALPERDRHKLLSALEQAALSTMIGTDMPSPNTEAIDLSGIIEPTPTVVDTEEEDEEDE